LAIERIPVLYSSARILLSDEYFCNLTFLIAEPSASNCNTGLLIGTYLKENREGVFYLSSG